MAVTVAPVQRAGTASGARGSGLASPLPARLRLGLESLSGISLDDVRVHAGSGQPAGLGAAAFSRGGDIHLAPGAAQHLPHEAWHVVQQRQGRVTATGLVGGLPLNDDPHLEAEADAMGARALAGGVPRLAEPVRHDAPPPDVVQRYEELNDRWVLSDDQDILLEQGSQLMFATEDAVDTANAALEGKGSYVRLQTGPACEYPGYTHLYRVTPAWAGKDAMTDQSMGLSSACRTQSQIANRKKGANDTPDFHFWADCSKAGQSVIGSRDANLHDIGVMAGNQKHPGVKKEMAPSKFAGHLATALYREAYPGEDASTKTAKQLRDWYAGLDDEAKDEVNTAMGMNDKAAPDVGDAYVIASETSMTGFERYLNTTYLNEENQRENDLLTETEANAIAPNKFVSATDNTWVYHVAGVVMQSGTDRVTLEGFSVGLANTHSSDNWTFCMLGTSADRPEQTFHAQHMARKQHGTKATTMVVRGPGRDPVAHLDGIGSMTPYNLIKAILRAAAEQGILKGKPDTLYPTVKREVDRPGVVKKGEAPMTMMARLAPIIVNFLVGLRSLPAKTGIQLLDVTTEAAQPLLAGTKAMIDIHTHNDAMYVKPKEA